MGVSTLTIARYYLDARSNGEFEAAHRFHEMLCEALSVGEFAAYSIVVEISGLRGGVSRLDVYGLHEQTPAHVMTCLKNLERYGLINIDGEWCTVLPVQSEVAR